MMFKTYINIYNENPKIWGFALSLFLISTFILCLSLTDVLVNNPFEKDHLVVAIIYVIINRPFIYLFKNRFRGEEISFSISNNIKQLIHNIKEIFTQDKRGWSIAFIIVFALFIVLVISNMFSDLAFFTLMPILFGLIVFYKRRKNELQDKGML